VQACRRDSGQYNLNNGILAGLGPWFLVQTWSHVETRSMYRTKPTTISTWLMVGRPCQKTMGHSTISLPSDRPSQIGTMATPKFAGSSIAYQTQIVSSTQRACVNLRRIPLPCLNDVQNIRSDLDTGLLVSPGAICIMVPAEDLAH
jgi:hypothetical protein